jgi:hypothetical protein
MSTPTSPDITCPQIRAFDAADLGAVTAAFHGAPASVLGQAWRAHVEPDFRSATVWTGWREDQLLVFAELNDADIFSFASQPNERLWERGDTLEIFLRPAQQAAYSELQVAPNNCRLQLRYADAEAVEYVRRHNSFGPALIREPTFRSRTWVHPEIRCWYALVEIPAASVCVTADPLPGSTWHFSYSRYDYTRGQAQPVISSTSAHTQLDFHRQAEWGILRF